MLLFALLASGVQSVIALVMALTMLGSRHLSRFMHLGIPFAAGTIMGNVFFHLLPELLHEGHYELETGGLIIIGVLVMLLIEAYFHCSHDSVHEMECADHGHHHGHLGMMSLVGDGLHNFLDGIAIGTAFLISMEVGIATTIVIAFHEIPQELADVVMMKKSKWSMKKIIWANVGIALTALLGVGVVFALQEVNESAIHVLLPLAIGQFIYIAMADLLPEIHRNKSSVGKYVVEIVLLCAGLALMYGLVSFFAHGH